MSRRALANQRVFDAALNHIRAQGEPSIVADRHSSTGVSCRYRTQEGLSCAFAPCIKEYIPRLENKNAGVLRAHYRDFLHTWALDAGDYLCWEVQKAHDAAATQNGPPDLFLSDFEHNMRMVAAHHNLEYTPL